MNFLYPTLAGLAVLVVFLLIVGRQNRDLWRARAYRELFARLVPLLSTGVFIAALPFVMGLISPEDLIEALVVYVIGVAVLAAVNARLVAPEERRATSLFGKEEYEAAAEVYRKLLSNRPLPRYYSALAASLDAAGEPHEALEAADRAVKLDPKLGVAYYNRASAHAALGELESAREDLERVFRSDANRRLRRATEEALLSLREG